VLLAAPAVLLGLGYAALLLFASARSSMMAGGMCALLLAPVIGILSLGVWSERRQSRD